MATTPLQSPGRASTTKSDWELLREKYGLNKKKKKKKGHPSLASTVAEAVAEADKKSARPKIEKEGFLISFRLSLAYRALERQELVASKPTLTPQKKFRRRQPRSKHRDVSAHKEPATTEVEKARQKLKSNTQVSFWKQMISVRHVTKAKETGKEKEAKSKEKSPRSSRQGTPKSARSSTKESKEVGSLAVIEWERRKAVRKQEQHDKRQRLKSAKTPKKEKKGKGKDGDKAALLKEAAGVHVQRPTSHRTPRDVTSAASTITRPPSARSSPRGASSSARLPSPSNTVSASRPSSAHWSVKSTVSLFSDDKPAKPPPKPTLLPGAITVSVDPADVASTAAAATDVSGAQSLLNVPSFSAKTAHAPPLVSNYVRRLGSMKLLIPKPDPAYLREPKRRPAAQDMEASSVAGEEQEQEAEHRYRPCHYLYNMCNCQKVGRPKTISKLLRVRKISGVIKIFGCPEEPQKTSKVCPFCQTFPRQKVYAWLNDVDQEVEHR